MALELRCVFITLGRPTVRTRRTTSSPASSASRPSRPAAETPILYSVPVSQYWLGVTPECLERARAVLLTLPHEKHCTRCSFDTALLMRPFSTQAAEHYKGFRGPPCFNASSFPPVPPPPPPPPPPRGFKLESPDGQWCLAGHKLALSACDAEGLPPQWVVGDAATGELEWAASGGGNASLCIKLHEEPGWDCANVDPDKTARRRNPSTAFPSTAVPRAVASPECLACKECHDAFRFFFG